MYVIELMDGRGNWCASPMSFSQKEIRVCEKSGLPHSPSVFAQMSYPKLRHGRQWRITFKR